MKWHAGIIWRQWLFGIWWWPVKKDLAFGLQIGPLHIYRLRGL